MTDTMIVIEWGVVRDGGLQNDVPLKMGVQGPGSRVQGPGSRVQSPGFRVQGSVLTVLGSDDRHERCHQVQEWFVDLIGGSECE
jgi:hypothetical protein